MDPSGEKELEFTVSDPLSEVELKFTPQYWKRLVLWEDVSNLKCNLCKPLKIWLDFGLPGLEQQNPTTKLCKRATINDEHLAYAPRYALCKRCAKTSKSCIECGERADVFYVTFQAPMPPGWDHPGRF